MTDAQKMVWSHFYKELLSGGNNYFHVDIKMNKEQLEVFAHNIACLIAWEIGDVAKRVFDKRHFVARTKIKKNGK